MNEGVRKLLEDRYFLKDETEWDQVAERVGEIYEPIIDHIKNMDFIPSTPTLLNANTNGERIGTLSSCFPMGINDSIEEIGDAKKECMIVTKYGGGIGYDFSNLRSSKEIIKSIKRNSSGPLPFIGGFNAILIEINQGGVRRGAGMALLSIEHPNILEFIKAKDDITKLNRFNFSIKIPDSFYKKLDKEPNAVHIVKSKNGEEYELEDKEGKKITVKQLWDMIIHQAWKSAEPGIFNETTAYEQCTCKHISDTVICNPCAEFVHVPYSSCNLGSINISNCVLENGEFSWEKLNMLVQKSTIFLNNVIDKNRFPIEKIRKVTKATRPIGLGVMGLAHALYKMKIPYNSKKAKSFTEKLIYTMTIDSMKVSISLAKEHGSYKEFDFDTFVEANNRFFISKLMSEKDRKYILDSLKKYGCYNSSQTSIAPTGSISTIAETSSGMEPVFALTYQRRVEKIDKEYDIMYITDPIFEKYLDDNFDDKKKKKILEEISSNKGSCQKCRDIPDEIKKIFVVAGDLTAMEHLDILEAVSKNTSLSVSKCVSKDTLIKTEGGYRYISDLDLKNRKKNSFSDLNIKIYNKNEELEDAISFYYNGESECKKITLSNGIQFTATNNHKILIKGQWVKMSDLQIGDKI
jgi:ribonucleoside-diphosphate reductase alpha chain